MALNERQSRGLAIALLVVGIPLTLYGLYSFGSNFFSSEDEFFANPRGSMDRTMQSAFIGMACMFVGSILSSSGLARLKRRRPGDAHYTGQLVSPEQNPDDK